jgi:hypothetical protein
MKIKYGFNIVAKPEMCDINIFFILVVTFLPITPYIIAMKKINIRCSMLPGYSDCPRRGAAKQFSDIITDAGFKLRDLPCSVGASLGTGCHVGSIMMADSVIDNGIAWSLSDAIEASIDKFRKLTESGVMWDNSTRQHGDAEKQIKILVNSFAKETLPIVKPVRTEYSRCAYIPDVEITGHTDIESDIGIDDLKFGSANRVYIEQLGAYSLVRKSEDKKPVKQLRIFHMPRVPIRKPYPGMAVYEYDVNEAEKSAWYTINMIKAQVKKFIETGNPWCFPANHMSMMCSDKYCPAWGTDFCKMGSLKK